jgi:hypothetical protein
MITTRPQTLPPDARPGYEQHDQEVRRVSRLIRMDHTGHSTLAEWSAADGAAYEAAVEEFRRELDEGYIAVLDGGGGKAAQVHELPREADLVIMRRPIAGG